MADNSGAGAGKWVPKKQEEVLDEDDEYYGLSREEVSEAVAVLVPQSSSIDRGIEGTGS